MDPEIKKLLEGIREDVGNKNTDLQARIDEIQKAAEGRTADIKTLRTEIDEVKRVATERENTIRDLQQKVRNERLARDPLRDKMQALRLFGMMARRALARFTHSEIPVEFRGEDAEIKSAMERMGRATLEEGTGSGTIFIPTILESEMLIDTLEEVQPTLAMADVIPGFPTKATIPTLTGRPTLQPKRASSDTAMTQSDPTFSSLSIDTEEAYIFFPVDNWLMQMAPAMLGNMLLPLTRDSIFNALDNWLFNADATATYNSIRGILQENTATYISSMAATKTAFSDVTFQDVRQLKAKVLGRGRSRGAYFMSDSVLAILEDIQREGKLPLVTYPGDGSTPRICGKPVIIDEFMPEDTDSAVSKAFIGFGDLKTFVVAIAGNGIQLGTSTEYLWGKNQTAFRGTVHVDIKRKPANTFRILKTAAA